MNKITTEKLLKVKQSTTKTIRSVIELDKKLTSKSAKLTKFLWKKLQQYCTLLIPADKHDDGYSIVSRSRLIVFGVIIVILVLILRLLFITTKDIYTHKQHFFNKKKPFSRLEIVDRNGQVLANNIIKVRMPFSYAAAEPPRGFIPGLVPWLSILFHIT